MRTTTKLAAAGIAVGCAFCVAAPHAAAEVMGVDRLLYFAGTRQSNQPSETSPTEWTSFFDPTTSLLVTTVQYPRDLAPLIGTKTLDQSAAEGRAAANSVVSSADGTITLVGVSQGAVVAQLVKTDLASTHNVKLITYGDPTNTDGGLLGKLPVGIPGFITNYRANDDLGVSNTTYAIEYDIIADAPDLPNPVSWVNALMGASYNHPKYSLKYIADYELVTTTDGNNTHVLIKTPNLPLVQPLRDMGVDENLVKAVEKPLKQIVDSGYTGNRTSDSTTTLVTGNKVSPDTDQKPISKVGSRSPGLKQAVRDTRATLKKAISDSKATLKRLLKPPRETTQQTESVKDAA